QGGNATRINFSLNGGVGLRWNTRPRNALTAGYRWVHVSNAETTTNNPGLDNNVFYLAYSFLRCRGVDRSHSPNILDDRLPRRIPARRRIRVLFELDRDV